MLNSPKEPFADDSADVDASAEDTELRVVVIDSQQVRWAAGIDDWNAATLLACISEDPADWSDIAAVWPRYQAGPSAEFADSLPMVAADLNTALGHLHPDGRWLVLDLQQSRIFSSARYGDVQRDGCFGIEFGEGDMKSDGPEDGTGEARIAVHLPPWWEIHNEAWTQQVGQQRETAVGRPCPRRDVLWGQPLADGLAERMGAVFQGPRWKSSAASLDRQARYRFTVEVHRDWLMAPREDLQGRMPRECLHGGFDWLDRVIEGQHWNVMQGHTPVRLPRDFSSGFETPMGRSEVCLYFDACREMIEAGWQWLLEHRDELQGAGYRATVARLSSVLVKAKDDWLRAPFEGPDSPQTIICNERDRIPQCDDRGEEGHVLDCDCPICKMMAEGLFGPTFLCFDGHHLELDDEFAFSLSETREEWESERMVFADPPAETDSDVSSRSTLADELDSVWKGSFVSRDLPGDPDGHLGLSFRLADIIGELQSRSAPQADIDSLNRAFVEYRHAGPEQGKTATEHFKEVLEQMAQQHAFLISRAADLQSQLDELRRRPAPIDTDI